MNPLWPMPQPAPTRHAPPWLRALGWGLPGATIAAISLLWLSGPGLGARPGMQLAAGLGAVAALALVAWVASGPAAAEARGERGTTAKAILGWPLLAWWLALATLPAGGTLLAVGSALALLVLAPSASRRSALTVLVLALLAAALLAAGAGALGGALSRAGELGLRALDMGTPLEPLGRHYEHVALLKTLAAQAWWGASDTNSVVLRTGPGWLGPHEPLQAMAVVGILPVAALHGMALAGWVAMAWFAHLRAATGRLQASARSLLIALAALHVAATLASLLWTFGVTRQPFGPGLVPLVANAAWWPLTVAVIVCLGLLRRPAMAPRQWSDSQATPITVLAGLAVTTTMLALGLAAAARVA